MNETETYYGTIAHHEDGPIVFYDVEFEAEILTDEVEYPNGQVRLVKNCEVFITSLGMWIHDSETGKDYVNHDNLKVTNNQIDEAKIIPLGSLMIECAKEAMNA